MFALVMGMLLCVAVGAAVIAYAARESQRDSRDFWTPEGERLIAGVRRRGTELKAQGEGIRQHARRATVRTGHSASAEEQTAQTEDPPAPAAVQTEDPTAPAVVQTEDPPAPAAVPSGS